MAEASEGPRTSRRAAREAAVASELTAPSARVVLATIGGSVVLAVCVLSGALLAAVAVAFLGGLLAWGWVRLFDLPSPRGVVGVVCGAAVGSSAVAAFRTDDPLLRWVPVPVGLSVIAAFAHQILRTDGRYRLTAGLAGSVSAIALISCGLGYVGLAVPRGGPAVAILTIGGILVAVLAELLARHRAGRALAFVVTVLLCAGGGWLAAGPTGVPEVAAVLAAVVGALVSRAIRRVLSPLPAATSLPGAVGIGTSSVLLPGVAAYVVARVLVG